MKKIIAITLTLLLAFSGIAYGASKWGSFKGSQIIRLTVDKVPVKVTDVPAVNINQRTMVPIYLLAQAGINYTWDQVNQTVNIVPQKPVEAAKDELAPYVLELISQNVYKVLASTSDPKLANQGTGFIYNGYMVTNAHVAGDSSYAQVTIDGVGQKITKYKFVNKDTDLMGFEVIGGKSLPLATELPKVGDAVYAISYPHGELKISEGVVSKVIMLGGENIIVHTATIDKGSSGSPLFNGKGEVVGINSNAADIGGSAVASMYLEKELQ